MSVRQANPAIFLLPLNARDMDADASSGEHEAQPYERLLKKLLVHGDELLGVTDLSFFYVKVGDIVRYIQRDRLYYILIDQRIETSPLVKAIVKRLVSEQLENKPFLAYSLVSPHLPGYIFTNVEQGPISVDDLVKLLIDFGKSEGTVAVCTCKEIENWGEFETIYRRFYGSILDALELLKVDYSYGVSERGFCIVVDAERETGISIVEPAER